MSGIHPSPSDRIPNGTELKIFMSFSATGAIYHHSLHDQAGATLSGESAIHSFEGKSGRIGGNGDGGNDGGGDDGNRTGGRDGRKPFKTINWKRNLFFIWLVQILCIAGFSLALPFIPVYIRDTWGITGERRLGLWMSAFYFFGMLSFCVSTPIWGVLADRFGRKLMLLRACYVDAILFPCFLLAPNPVILILVRFITSAFTGTVAAAQTLIVTNTPEEHHGFALGTLSSAI